MSESTKVYRFLATVTLNSAMFEAGKVYPLSEVVYKQLDPRTVQEVSQSEIDASYAAEQAERERILAAQRVANGGLRIEDGAMNRAAQSPVGTEKPAPKKNDNVEEAEAAKPSEELTDESNSEEQKKGTDFRQKGKNK